MLILTAGRSGWWIETELQKRFRQYRIGFGNLGSDDGLVGFSVWERKMGYGHGGQVDLVLSWIPHCIIDN